VFEPNITYINESGYPETVIKEIESNQEIASVIEKWTRSVQQMSSGTAATSVTMFHRNRWDEAQHEFADIGQAAWAVENDDILSTLSDVTESLMFQRCRFETYDQDQQDVWNQWAAEIDLDSRLREIARELFKVSQVYVGIEWGTRTYRVRDSPVEALGGSEKQRRKRRKEYVLKVPVALTILEPIKVLPVGPLMFNRETLAYIASDEEDSLFHAGHLPSMIVGRYSPTNEELTLCGELGISPNRLWTMRNVHRHTLTRAQYERFAKVRLRSIIPLLEMKHHLRNSDRAVLIGNSNFIVVITKGSDKYPAKNAELDNLKEQAKVIARLPVLVGDHRLHVEIVSPNLDNILTDSRWQVLDSRLVFKALQTFSPISSTGTASGSGVSEMSRIVARGLESRRHMMVRFLEREIFGRIRELNPELGESPSLVFNPKRITLDFRSEIFTQILKLRDRGDVSRETALEELEFDQDVEVLRRARERDLYDEVFQSATPHSSPMNNPYQSDNTQPQNMKQTPKQIPKEVGRPPGVVDENPREPKA
jgi:hypothetical protein